MRIATFTANASLDVTFVVDRFRTGGIYRARASLAFPGGKGLNVARFAHAMGAEVVATGFAGGFTGERILAGLAELGIESAFVRIPGESRMCVTILDEAGGTETEIREPGPPVPQEAVEAAVARVASIVEPAKVVALSGSLPPGCPVALYRRLVHVIHRCGGVAVLDTSGDPLHEALAAGPDLIKPNRQEFEALTGWPVPTGLLDEPSGGHAAETDEAFDELCRVVGRLRQAGPGTVVLSLGGAGSVVFSGDRVLRVWPPPVPVRSTVSCGDAVVAGFALALAEGLPLEEAARLATAMGAAAAMQPGTGILDPADVRRLGPAVTIRDRTPGWWPPYPGQAGP